jgi:hypothetical protein
MNLNGSLSIECVCVWQRNGGTVMPALVIRQRPDDCTPVSFHPKRSQGLWVLGREPPISRFTVNKRDPVVNPPQRQRGWDCMTGLSE